MDNPTHQKLIAALNESLKKTKIALKDMLERRAELEKQPGSPPDELQRIKLEIAPLENSIEQAEQAIGSLTGRFERRGFEVLDFDLGRKN
jgi:chromosome segregation ATPase